MIQRNAEPDTLTGEELERECGIVKVALQPLLRPAPEKAERRFRELHDRQAVPLGRLTDRQFGCVSLLVMAALFALALWVLPYIGAMP